MGSQDVTLSQKGTLCLSEQIHLIMRVEYDGFLPHLPIVVRLSHVTGILCGCCAFSNQLINNRVT